MDRTEKFVLGGLALFLFGVVVSSVVFISTLGRTVEKQDTAALQPQPRVAKQAVVAPIVNADRAVEFQPIAIEKSNEALVFGVPTPAKTEHDWELCSGRLDKLNKKLARLGRQLVAERNEEGGYLIDNGFQIGTVNLYYPNCRVAINFSMDVANVFFDRGETLHLKLGPHSMTATQDGLPEIRIDTELGLHDDGNIENSGDVISFAEVCKAILVVLDKDGSLTGL